MTDIITSLLDNDFYKFTMMQAVYHNYTRTKVKYQFKWRNREDCHIENLWYFREQLSQQIDKLCELRFTTNELKYLSELNGILTSDFIEFLENFKLRREDVKIFSYHNDINIEISGYWVNTILFETPVLSIVSELYTRQLSKYSTHIHYNYFNRLEQKIEWLNKQELSDEFVYVDLGGRRRALKSLHFDGYNYQLNNTKHCIGTSNVFLAKTHNQIPKGTMAHEWIQAHQQLGYNIIDCQKHAFDIWTREYRGELGIALSDCLTFELFLKHFDRYFALLFDGVRLDSGDMYEQSRQLIDHYCKLKIPPYTKSLIYSDGLNFEKAVDLFETFHHLIKTSFGIGTFLTNDCNFIAPQIVLKMILCNGEPVAKVSNDSGKGMCPDPTYEEYLKYLIHKITK